MLNGLDVFGGAGQLTKALSEWVIPIAYCEKDQSLAVDLLLRMSGGELPSAPVWDDLNSLKGEFLPEIDIVYGFIAHTDCGTNGTGESVDQEREQLLSEIRRLCGEVRPRFIFLENVAGNTLADLNQMNQEYFELGYMCRWGMAAPNQMERWFVLGYDVHTKMFAENKVSSEPQTEFKNFVPLADLPQPKINRRLDNQIDTEQSRHAFKLLLGIE